VKKNYESRSTFADIKIKVTYFFLRHGVQLNMICYERTRTGTYRPRKWINVIISLLYVTVSGSSIFSGLINTRLASRYPRAFTMSWMQQPQLSTSLIIIFTHSTIKLCCLQLWC